MNVHLQIRRQVNYRGSCYSAVYAQREKSHRDDRLFLITGNQFCLMQEVVGGIKRAVFVEQLHEYSSN